MDKEQFNDIWDRAELEYKSPNNNSFTFKHYLFTELNDELEELLPRLTIPKEIAKQLDSINASEYESLVDNFIESYYDYSLSEKLTDFSSKNFTNYTLCIVYLSSKELGKRLVEVVPDED